MPVPSNTPCFASTSSSSSALASAPRAAWRRRKLLEASPNAAHASIAALEKLHDVTVLTQNVDNLHERAGSTRVVNLQGELTKVTSSRDRLDPDCIREYPLDVPIRVGDRAADGSQLRPAVVFFDEFVHGEEAERIAREADVFAIVGTSLTVSTSMVFPSFPRRDVPRYVIDPVDYRQKLPAGYIWIPEKACRGLELFAQEATSGFPLFEQSAES